MQNFLEKPFKDVTYKGYNFNHIAAMNIITIANKWDMWHDFYLKHNMRAVEWKLNAMINKDKSLDNKIYRNWRQPINEHFENCRV